MSKCKDWNQGRCWVSVRIGVRVSVMGVREGIRVSVNVGVRVGAEGWSYIKCGRQGGC